MSGCVVGPALGGVISLQQPLDGAGPVTFAVVMDEAESLGGADVRETARWRCTAGSLDDYAWQWGEGVDADVREKSQDDAAQPVHFKVDACRGGSISGA